MYADEIDSMESETYGGQYDSFAVEEFGSTSWMGGADSFGVADDLGPAGDEDFSIRERRRKTVVGVASAVAAIVGTLLLLYAFSAGMG